MVTTATVIARTSSTFTAYGEPVWVEGSGATTTGFFQLGSSQGISRGGVVQQDPGQALGYDAMWYGRPASIQPAAENDILQLAGTRYRVQNINPVFVSGTTVDHYEIYLGREEGIK